jgi:hypothetical protein
MMILLTTAVSEKRIMQNGEKNREKTVLWVLHKNGCHAMWSFAWKLCSANCATVLLSTAVLARA